MQFPTRQLLLYVAGLSVWFGVMAHGHNTFGSGGVLLYGSLLGISILAAVKIISRWTSWTAAERSMCAVVFLLSLSSGVYVASVWYGYGFHRPPKLVRDANQLQETLFADTRFDSVAVSYETPHYQKHSWLWVRGSVTDQESLVALREIIGDDEKWRIEWDVEVVPK